jgi:hypothetical protein
MGLAEDPEIRAALAMNENGTCCRHPNIAIICYQTSSGGSSGISSGISDGGGGIQIHACRICASEAKAGGVRQRKSFSLIIDQVQKFHANKSEWNAFKQNWDDHKEKDKDQAASQDDDDNDTNSNNDTNTIQQHSNNHQNSSEFDFK